MKRLSKLLALTLAVVMVLAMATTAFAAGTGTLTITNATKGQAYNAYKVFNAVYADPTDMSKGVVYTVPAGKEAVITSAAPFEVSPSKASNGEYIVNKKAAATDDQILEWVKANYASLDGTAHALTFDAANSTASATLEYGYYYVTSSLGAVVSIDTVNNSVTVVDKNESQPEGPVKTITAEDSSVNEGLDQTGLTVIVNEAAVGSVESFQVDFKAVNWVQTEGVGTKTQVTEYNFIDTPVGLGIDKDSVKVYVNYGNAAQAEVTSTIADISVDASGKLTFTIPWVDASNNSLYATQTAGSELIPVHVTYNATVLDAAATATATNTVEVKYNGAVSLGTDTTSTYTYKFDLKKTDGTNPLDGAKFELYYSADGTTATGDALKFTLVGDVYHYDPSGTVTAIVPTGANASASIVGLDDAKYILKEIQAPNGYNPAADQAVNGLTRVDTAGDPLTITVINNKGTELPSTGGIGTTIFYVVGAVLVLGAGVLLITKKRMSDAR